MSDITARKQIFGDSFNHDDSQESDPNHKPQDQSVRLLMESLRSSDFRPESDNGHVKAQKHQVHSRLGHFASSASSSINMPSQSHTGVLKSCVLQFFEFLFCP